MTVTKNVKKSYNPHQLDYFCLLLLKKSGYGRRYVTIFKRECDVLLRFYNT